MKIHDTPINGVKVIELEPIEDERGWFARGFCRDEFEAAGLNPDIAQCNVSFNAKAGTLRGMHYQAEPFGETKLVTATRGAVYDVAVDLRPDSPTYCRWHAQTLSAANGLAFYIPRGCAHGFQSLEPDSQLLYYMGAAYQPDAGRGVRWNDPAFGIHWPDPPAGATRIIGERDATYPDFSADRHTLDAP